jgi:hypothetical protein
VAKLRNIFKRCKLQSSVEDCGKPTPNLNSIREFKEQLEGCFNIIIAKIAHRRKVAAHLDQLIISWDFIVHDSPNKYILA